MKRFSIQSLRDNDFKIVENKKWIFSVPAAILVVALIMMLIFSFTAGAPLNLGMDFAGGYATDIRFTELTAENYDYYIEEIDKIANNLQDEDGNNYKLRIDKYRKIGGDGADSAIRATYKLIRGKSDAEMEEINTQFAKELEDVVLKVVPDVLEISNGVLPIVYRSPLAPSSREYVMNQLSSHHSGATAQWQDDNRTLHITNPQSFEYTPSELKSQLALTELYAGSITPANMVSGSVSRDLIIYAVCAIIVALLVMMVYIVIRFRMVSFGLSSILCLLHDLIIMFAFMIIFHVEITGTLIAALITILGYSINNTIVIFDRVRENLKTKDPATSFDQIANRSVKETLTRSLYTGLTTFIMIGMIALVCAIAGIADMVVFALPILIGLIAGTYSSVLMAPSLWTIFRKF